MTGPAGEEAARAAVRRWVLERNPDLPADGLRDDTPLLRDRLVTSVQVLDLLLLVESLRDAPIDPVDLIAGSFADVDTIARTFLGVGR